MRANRHMHALKCEFDWRCIEAQRRRMGSIKVKKSSIYRNRTYISNRRSDWMCSFHFEHPRNILPNRLLRCSAFREVSADTSSNKAVYAIRLLSAGYTAPFGCNHVTARIVSQMMPATYCYNVKCFVFFSTYHCLHSVATESLTHSDFLRSRGNAS